MKLPLQKWLDVAALKQTLRIAAACATAYAAYRVLGLRQGYWAVFTVLIVMQGSIGSTLGAAVDRLLGTLLGAGLGAVGAWLAGGGVLGTGAVLVMVTALCSYVAVLRPRLRIAPVTASIMMLTVPPATTLIDFVIGRVSEILLGGVVGVAAMALILPARSEALVTTRAANVLDALHDVLAVMSRAVVRGEAPSVGDRLAALRPALDGMEQALRDADREHAARLWPHAISPAIPRTMWRMRSDVVLIARALGTSPQAVGPALSVTAGEMLLGLGAQVRECSIALRGRRAVARIDLAAASASLHEALAVFRASPNVTALDLNVAAHVFGLSFAIDELSRDLADLADRIDETFA